MKRFFFLSIFSSLATICQAQDMIIKTLVTKSDIIVKATAFEFGNVMRLEDGVLQFTVYCRVDENYKGVFQKNDTIRIFISEFCLCQGMQDSLLNKNKLIQLGKPYIYEPMSSGSKLCPVYPIIDFYMGVQAPNDEIIYYLEEFAKKR